MDKTVVAPTVSRLYFQVSNGECGAALLVGSGSTSSFFCCARYLGICACKEAYSIECCIAGRGEEPKYS